jgi:small subunit ribosomal protein S3
VVIPHQKEIKSCNFVIDSMTEEQLEPADLRNLKKPISKNMGQKVNPIGFRLGVIKGWDSNWYGGKDFAEKLVEDEKIRKYILARIPKGGISKIIIERTLKRITITINTARPGVVIGKGGQEVDKIKEELKKLTNKDVQIKYL